MEIYKYMIRAGALALCLAVSVTQISWSQSQSINPHGPLSADLDCQSCHTTEGWSPLLAPMSFDHDTETRFPLTGSHVDVTCASCHLDLRFDEPAAEITDCATCHVDVHQGDLGANCTMCHNTTTFQLVEAIEVHNETQFPLTGAHTQVTCESCHTNDAMGHFGLVETECIACHEPEYQLAQTPNHVAGNFSTDCETCHNPIQWQGALFDHITASQGFELIGAHNTVACAGCHTTPDLGLIHQPANNLDCIACHRADYLDEHGPGFPTTCLDCHNQNDWEATDFDHDNRYFPIFRGEHRGEWNNDCQTCHIQPNNFAIFSCITCHEHNKADMDDEHRGITGYVYDSIQCYSCHPNGEED